MGEENRKTPRGFVDAHVHIQEAAGLGDVVAAGIVAVRDAGTQLGAGLGSTTSPGDAPSPRVLSAGRGLFKKDGYGSFLGVSLGTREEIQSEIAALNSAGAGIIKAVASGVVSLKKPGSITPGGFDGPELDFIVQEAGKHGLGVMAHANGEQAIMAALSAGVRSIEHGFFMTRAALALMAGKGDVFWVPTVGALARAAGSGTASAEARDFVDALIQSHLEMIGYAYAAGVSLALGTDCVIPHPEYGKAYEAELMYFEQAGIPPGEVKKIACEGGARLLGI